MEEQRYWEEIFGFVSENRVDKRWILKSNIDEKAHGSLRIVSHPDLKPGFLRAYASYVVKRTPKTEEEKKAFVENYQMEVTELELYSADEHVETKDIVHEERFQDLEELFKVNIF
jgi:hypothetical protein